MHHPSLHLYADAQLTSPYAMSVFVALVEKGLPFELSTVDLSTGAQHDADYARLSLTARVPCLRHGELALSESSAIAEYLDEMFPGTRLYPADPPSRARARQVQAWLRSDLLPIRQERNTQVLFYGARKPALSAQGVEAARKLVSVAEELLPPTAEHLFGAWSIADVDLALMLNRLALNGDPLPTRLASYAYRQWQRPSVQRWIGLSRPPL